MKIGELARRVREKLGTYWPDRDVRSFIAHNVRCFSDFPGRSGGAEVLFELNAAHSALIAYSYLANVLARKHGARITAFAPVGADSFARGFEWKLARALSLREFAVYRSFGVSGFVRPELNKAQEERAHLLQGQVLAGLKTKSDIESIHVEGVWLGDLIYDTYLRAFRRPTIEIADESFRNSLREAMRLYVFWDDYFRTHDVRAVNVSHTGYVLAIPLRIAVSREIPVYQINATHAYLLDRKHLIAYSEFREYRERFRSLSPEVQAEGIELAKQRITQRLSGKVGVDMRYSTKSAYGAHQEGRLLKESSRIKVLVAPHCFFDSPHGYGKNLFPDFYEWLDFLGRISMETDYDWYIKTHPDYLPGNMEIINSFLEKYPKFNLLPASSSHLQIIAEGINVALTTYGTIGFEYAALGIPVINASVNNPHIAYDFNLHPKTVDEYRQLLLNLDKLDLKIDKQQVYEYYFMKNIYNTEGWLFRDYDSMVKELGGYKKQFTSRVYAVWLREWTPERHAEKIAVLNAFVDSGDFRLGRQHFGK